MNLYKKRVTVMNIIKVSSQRRRNLFIILGIFVVVASTSAVAILNRSAINRQLHAWKVLPEPERLTELYFSDHAHLPGYYIPGDAQNVAFTVHNLEYRTTSYKYTITQQSRDGSQTQELGSGNFTIKEGQYQKTTVSITLADLGTDTKVVVKLNDESIHYIMTKVGV
jgi:Protein of unknown function (DUF1616)